MHQVEDRPYTLEDRFSTSLSLPHTGELAYHELSGANGRVQVLHREHVVDPFLPLSAAPPAHIVALIRHSNLAAGYRDLHVQAGEEEAQPSEIGTLESSQEVHSGGSRLQAFKVGNVIGGLLFLVKPRALVLSLSILVAVAMQDPVTREPMNDAHEGRPWRLVRNHPSLASLEEHSTVGRSWSLLDARETLGIVFDAQAGLPEFRFCIWSPADWSCFFLPGSSAPTVLRERLFEAKVALGRHDCVLWDPLPPDRAIHLVATVSDPALVTVVVDTGREYLCLDVSRQRFGVSLLSALQLLCPDRCFRVPEDIRTPVRSGDVIKVFDDSTASCQTPQFFVPRFTLPPVPDVGTQLVYIASVDMGVIRLRVPTGVETGDLERALVVWLGRQRCLGTRLLKLDLDVSVPVYCLPRRGKSTLAVGLIDLADSVMDTIVHVVDSTGLADLDCEVLREPWRPGSLFWNDILARGPVCVSCWQASTGLAGGGAPIGVVTLGIDICRALGAGWRPPVASSVPEYDLVIAAEHLGIHWRPDSTALTRHATTQTSAAFWPMQASPLFSSAMPVPRKADGQVHNPVCCGQTYLGPPSRDQLSTEPINFGCGLMMLAQAEAQPSSGHRQLSRWWSPVLFLLLAGHDACSTGVGVFLFLPLAWAVSDAGSSDTPSVLHSSSASEGLTAMENSTLSCPVAWCHELSCQSTHFTVNPESLAAYFASHSPQELVRVQLWNPFQGPSLFDFLRADPAAVLHAKLLAAGHDPLRRVLYVAFDTQSTVVDIISVPPASGRWWIVRDGISRELLRPVTTWVEENRRAVVTLNSHGQATSLTSTPEVASLYNLPQGARGVTAAPLTKVYGGIPACTAVSWFRTPYYNSLSRHDARFSGAAHRNILLYGLVAFSPSCVLADESDDEAPDGPTEPSSPALTDLQAPTPTGTVEHGIDPRVGIIQRTSDSSLAHTSAPLRGDYEPLISTFDLCAIPRLQRTVAACLSDVDTECPANPFVMSEAIPSPQASVHLIPAAADSNLASVVLRSGSTLQALCLTRAWQGNPYRRIALHGRQGRLREPYSVSRGIGGTVTFRDGDCLHADMGPFGPPPPTPATSLVISPGGKLTSVALYVVSAGIAAAECRFYALGGDLKVPAFIRIWTPRIRPPILVCVAAGEGWDPAEGTFSGEFRTSHPGRWAPVRWTPCRLPHFVQVSDEEQCANVLFEDSSGVICVTLDRQVTPFDIMHGTADSCRGVRVLGNFHIGAHAPLELRDGDVVVTGPLAQVEDAAWPDLRSAAAIRLPSWPLLWIPCLGAAVSRVGCMVSVLATSVLATSRSGAPHLHGRSRSPHREDTSRCPSPRIGYWRPERRHQMSLVATRSECHLQVLCPFRGWGPPVPYTRTMESQQIMRVVHRDSGNWAVGILPLGGSHVEHFTVILPLPPAPLVAVLLHTAGTSRAVLLPSCITLRQISDYFVSLTGAPGMRALVPPALKRIGGYEDETVRLRHGDTFELEAGWVSVWSTDGDGNSCHSRHWIPDGALWSPRPLAEGRWVPAAYLPEHHVSFVEQPEPQAVHVLLSQPYDSTATVCRRLMLDPSAERTALNRVSDDWQLRPDLQARVVVTWPRNGDIMVPRILRRAFHYSLLSANVAGLMRRPCWALLGLVGMISITEGAAVPSMPDTVGQDAQGERYGVDPYYVIALAALGTRHLPGYLAALPAVSAMVVPPAEQQQLPPVPIGKHPWRVPQQSRVCGDSVAQCTRARLLSPFCGEGDEVEVSPDTPVEDLRISLSSTEPYWYGELMPVWPAIWPYTAVYMPIPSGGDLVCVAAVSPGWQLAVLIPRRTDLEWLLAYLRRMTPVPVLSVHPPVAARPKDDPARGAIDWRTGDVILAFQCGTAATHELPTFFSPEHVRYAAIWSHDFVVHCELPLLVWRVGRPPSATVMPPPARWVSSEQTFTGEPALSRWLESGYLFWASLP
ncbi:pol [Symbiodinium necroappetens]|uniref:Pol protein n=1 Tax=Symbiodinium necroappetens TaxID=1628268 RepID=A0A813B4Z3_9DINO|nr:pol [Symbiodinium necroappetens]